MGASSGRGRGLSAVAEDDFAGIDVDEATVEVIRANDPQIQRLSAELPRAVPTSIRKGSRSSW